MADPLRLIFMGSDAIALPLLDWIAGPGSRLVTLVGALTGPDRPSGRGQAVRPNPVASWLEGRPFPVFKPAKLDASMLESVRALKADVALVVAYGQILRDDFISAPRLGTLNLHASLLPKYRGASPIQTAVAQGETQTAMSLMRIVRELDAGPVADVQTVPIAALDTALDVEKKLAAASVELLERSLPRLALGDLRFTAQEHEKATFCRRLGKGDSAVDFGCAAKAIAARINGMNPWPSAIVPIGQVPVKVGLADSLEDPVDAPAGTVLGSDALGLRVCTAQGVLRLRRLQRPGGRMLEASEFLRGFPVEEGTLLQSFPMPALVSPTPFKR